MNIPILIVANNRPDYLRQVVHSLHAHLPAHQLWIHNDDNHHGMAANVSTGWRQMLHKEWDYLLHWEDDMVLLRPPPIDAMVTVMETFPAVANIILKRQPWNDHEHRCGGVVEAIRDLAPISIDHGQWVSHDHIFSLNPCLIRRSIVEKGWPPGNEAEMTKLLLDEGWVFGAWNDSPEPYIDHIGAERGPGWKL